VTLGKAIWTLHGEQAHLLMFREGVGRMFLEENLATFIKALKVCLTFDLISLLLGIYPKEIIDKCTKT
jgi:hypothetical protein